MTALTAPLTLRSLEIPNRIWMSPMCMYSAAPEGPLVGQPTEWHRAHYAARAAGGVGLVMVEATAVVPEGRISPQDLGLWSDEQTPSFAALAQVIREHGAVPGIQLAHAGRKASTAAPFRGGSVLSAADGGWENVGVSPIEFPGYPVPRELSVAELADVVEAFGLAARRAREAGFEVVEIHGAHGYLLSSSLSPLSNLRTDEYGGEFEGRTRLFREVTQAVRGAWAEELPVFARLSVTEWLEDAAEPGWRFEDTVAFAGVLRNLGVDLIDCSSGGNVPAPIPKDRDYQVRWAMQLRERTGVPVAAVGRINEFAYAAEVMATGSVDALFVGKALLTNPSFANHAFAAAGENPRYLEQYAYTARRG